MGMLSQSDFTVYVLDVKKTRPLTDFDLERMKSKRLGPLKVIKGGKHARVGVIVHGTREELEAYARNECKTRQAAIGGVYVVPLRDIMKKIT